MRIFFTVFLILLFLCAVFVAADRDCEDLDDWDYCEDLDTKDCHDIVVIFNSGTIAEFNVTISEDDILAESCCPSGMRCVCDYEESYRAENLDEEDDDVIKCRNTEAQNAGFIILLVAGVLGLLACLPCIIIFMFLVVVCFPCAPVWVICCIPCILPVVFLAIAGPFLARDNTTAEFDDDN